MRNRVVVAPSESPRTRSIPQFNMYYYCPNPNADGPYALLKNKRDIAKILAELFTTYSSLFFKYEREELLNHSARTNI